MPSSWSSSAFRASCVIGAFLIACLLLLVANGYADIGQTEMEQSKKVDRHSTGNYNFSLVGRFERSDGVIVKAGNRKTGVMLNPTTKCSFIFPDGTTVSIGKEYSICLVSIKTSSADLYRYEATFPFETLFPFASKIQQYDGYRFVDITSAGTRLFSAVIHLRTFSRDYLPVTVLVALLASIRFVGKRVIKPNAKRRWVVFVRGIGKIVYALLIIFFVLVLLSQIADGRTLLSVNLFILGVGILLYWLSDKLFRPKFGNQEL